MASVDWIRTGYQSVNSYLVSDSADALIAWLSEVFACSERGEREIHSDGRIGHAEVQIGNSVVMLSDASPDGPAPQASTTCMSRRSMPSMNAQWPRVQPTYASPKTGRGEIALPDFTIQPTTDGGWRRAWRMSRATATSRCLGVGQRS